MGEYTTSKGIRTFHPDDTDNKFYLVNNASLATIIERCREKWGDSWNMENTDIEAEYIHTACIGYDLYDPGDYTNYLAITFSPDSA